MTCWNSCQSLATPKRPHAHEVLSAMAAKYYNQGEVSVGSQVTHSPGTGRAQQGWNTGMLTPFVSVTDSMLTVSRKKAFSKAFFLFFFFPCGLCSPLNCSPLAFDRQSAVLCTWASSQLRPFLKLQ